ncbi:unnamed protein product [Cylicocyclus nassatus]|uniref:C2HC/C3H-type domain-containing protein n=1 Tax=Cylicocyclus nassatus TaxID=53992 RepID=A0AA36GKV0_CYLNA|nr:unnamed protein product [Cylicocyclus nassatus]
MPKRTANLKYHVLVAIHEPKCLEKWHIENQKLPKSQRRPPPKKPEKILKEDGEIDAVATNEAIWEHAQSQLIPCQNCGRTFATDRLSVHQKSCTPEHPARRAPSKTRAKSDNSN